MGALAFSLVIPTMLTLVLSAIAAHHSGFKPAATIISNYVTLFPALISFLVLYNGTRSLLRTTKGGAEKSDLRWYAPWALLFSVTFSHLAIENQYRWHSYHLGLWPLIVTFIVPYMYAWTLGLLSAYDLNLYAKTVPGTLYRQGIVGDSHAGSVSLILASIAIQFKRMSR